LGGLEGDMRYGVRKIAETQNRIGASKKGALINDGGEHHHSSYGKKLKKLRNGGVSH